MIIQPALHGPKTTRFDHLASSELLHGHGGDGENRELHFGFGLVEERVEIESVVGGLVGDARSNELCVDRQSVYYSLLLQRQRHGGG